MVQTKSSIDFYKLKAEEYLKKLDTTKDHDQYMYYYEEALWWLYLYNEARSEYPRNFLR